MPGKRKHTSALLDKLELENNPENKNRIFKQYFRGTVMDYAADDNRISIPSSQKRKLAGKGITECGDAPLILPNGRFNLELIKDSKTDGVSEAG